MVKKEEQEEEEKYQPRHQIASEETRNKRVKERCIGEVFEKVTKWRKLFDDGITTDRGVSKKINLEVAASMIGISRKTLDDYYLQIKRATQMGFDFKAHSDKKMGFLRNYVKRGNTNANEEAGSCGETKLIRDIKIEEPTY